MQRASQRQTERQRAREERETRQAQAENSSAEGSSIRQRQQQQRQQSQKRRQKDSQRERAEASDLYVRLMPVQRRSSKRTNNFKWVDNRSSTLPITMQQQQRQHSSVFCIERSNLGSLCICPLEWRAIRHTQRETVRHTVQPKRICLFVSQS